MKHRELATRVEAEIKKLKDEMIGLKLVGDQTGFVYASMLDHLKLGAQE